MEIEPVSGSGRDSQAVSVPVTWATLRSAEREHEDAASPTLHNTQSIKAVMITDAHIRYKLKLIALRVLYSAASAMLMFIHQNKEFEHLKGYWCRFIKERTERIEENVELAVNLEADEPTLIHMWFEETRAEVLELWTQLIAVDGTEVLFEAKSKSYVGAIHNVLDKIKKILLGEEVENGPLALTDYYQVERVVRERVDASSPEAQRAFTTIKRVRRFEAGFFNLWHPSLLRHQGWKDSGDSKSLQMMSKEVKGQEITVLTPIAPVHDQQALVEPSEESLWGTSTAFLTKIETLDRRSRLPVQIYQDSETHRDLMYFGTEEITVSGSKKIIPKLNSASLRQNLIGNALQITVNADIGRVDIFRPGAVSSLLRMRRTLGITRSSISVIAGEAVCTTIELSWETRHENVDKEISASSVQSDLEDALFNRRRVESEDWSGEDIELAAMYLRGMFERGLLQSGKVTAQQIYGEYSCWRLIYSGEPQIGGKMIRYHANRPHLLSSKALGRSRNGTIVVPLDDLTVKLDFTPKLDHDHTGGIVWHVAKVTKCVGGELGQAGEHAIVPMEYQPIALGKRTRDKGPCV